MIMKQISPYIILQEDAHHHTLSQLGGKAFAFMQLENDLLPIPPWFVVTASAFFDCLSEQQKEYYNKGEIHKLVSSLKSIKVISTVEQAIMQQLNHNDFCYYAVRSSATSEDHGNTSFAGQFESYLWISKKQVSEYICKVWLSAFSERVLCYRENNQISGAIEVPAVIVQKMVQADCAGVAFCVNPINGNINETVVSAVYGLGGSLVDGEANADVYLINSNQQVISKEIAKKDICHIIVNNQVKSCPVDEKKADLPVLTEEQAIQVALLSKQTSNRFGRYQDIEWAFENGTLYLLQSRPITTLQKTIIEQGRSIIFDNSNIAESYGSVTTPLTSSFISYVYEQVYYQFCCIFGVSKKTLQRHQLTFKCMLGFADGRVYYNLLSWYKMLSILPGYALNRKFMEQMMGVKEALPQEFLDGIKPVSTKRECFLDFFRLIKTLCNMIGHYASLERNIKRFYARVNDTLSNINLESLSLDELYQYYYTLENQLMSHWDTPLVNDFFTMIYHGLLKGVCKKWCKNPSVHNDLLCGQGGIISAEPAMRVRSMADYIQNDIEMINLFHSGEMREIHLALQSRPELQKLLSEYLEKFGDRCLDELKLESDSLTENPILLYRSIGSLAMKKERSGEDREQTRESAFQTIKADLKGHPIRKVLFSYIQRNASRLVRNRENLRFERTRVFGIARKIFIQMGIRLASYGVIQEKKDIFYLTRTEILGYIDGTTSSYDLEAIISVRKKEYDQNKQRPEPPRRFLVKDHVGKSPRTDMLTDNVPQTQGGNMLLHGLACCTGTVTGVARVVINPQDATMKDGEILIAQRTDPGWIMLFNLASAIVVERGSLLSHAAIVSREMGIPAVVSVDNVTQLIKDGDTICVNGALGTVEILSHEK